ncbi:hypothetical protein BT96DRAFT_359190 [Gymnopus androsaceus JB14]|uniref:Skg3/CAF120-like PH-like domain-containing protein n=1 Tax=Gymnopus androsaceus JB14 TaxID=1447944 RepID=A0A6A4I0A8_9AGAR|nr:hypothetical protein BT96DRAFT_359190 [Gymnopus androsaceus JB14]
MHGLGLGLGEQVIRGRRHFFRFVGRINRRGSRVSLRRGTYPCNEHRPWISQDHNHSPRLPQRLLPPLPSPQHPPPQPRYIPKSAPSSPSPSPTPTKSTFQAPSSDVSSAIPRATNPPKTRDGYPFGLSWAEPHSPHGIWMLFREAEKKGTEVPPSYINMTDAFVQVLGSVTIPGDPGKGVEEKKYTNVLTLNTAGCNLLLFACPDTKSLISWASALRLSAWEKSRLEEIYTAHLIRITLSARDIPTTLIRNRLEGWVRIRIASQTEWKLVWMVVKGATGTGAGTDELGRVQSNTPSLSKDPAQKKKRISSFFGAGNGHGQPSSIVEPPSGPMVSFYTSPPQGLYPSSGAPTASSKLRLNRKNASNTNPLLTLPIISQVFAVYPERPELISRSTLFKIEGCFGDEEGAGSMRRREGWVLVMPQVEQGGATSQSQASAPNSTGGAGLSPAAEMLKWIIALHDAFNLYGRPQAWTWDPREPQGLMFAYPVGPHKDLLFLDRELAETLDPRDDRTSSVRSALIGILGERMRLGGPNPAPNSMPTLPAGPGSNAGGPRSPTVGAGGGDIAPASRIPSGPQFQLPPLSFDSNRDEEDRDRDREDMGREMDRERALLTPITERSSVYTMQTTVTNFTGGGTLSGVGGVSVSPVPEEREMQNGSASPKVPEKDRVSLSGSLRRRGDLSAGGGGKSSFDSGTGFSFANAVNTALPPSRSGTVDSFSTNFNTSTNTPPTRSSTMSASTPTSSTTRSPPPPGSPSMSSVLTSPYEQGQQQTPPQGFAQLQGQGQASTQFRDRDRASVQSFADKASVLTSPYSPAGSVDGHGQPGYGGASSPSWSQLGLGLGSSFGVGDGTGSGSSRRIPTTIRELDGDGDSDGDLDEASRQGQRKGQGGEDDEEDDDDESPDLRNRYQDVTSRGPSIPTPTPEVNPLQAATWANVNAKASPQGSPILQTASPSPPRVHQLSLQYRADSVLSAGNHPAHVRHNDT